MYLEVPVSTQVVTVHYLNTWSECMKLTNQHVMDALSGLNELSNEKFPAKLAWKIQTARLSLEPFAKTMNEQMGTLRDKFAVKDAEGNFVPGVNEKGEPVEGTIHIGREHVVVFNKELEDLMGLEVEVNNVSIDIADFPDSIEVSPNSLHALRGILVG